MQIYATRIAETNDIDTAIITTLHAASGPFGQKLQERSK